MPEQIETEIYAIISNVDWTITKLNSIIKTHGYEFIPVSLQNLELQFSEVFNIPRTFEPKQSIVKSLRKEGFNVISEHFEEALKQFFALKHGDIDEPPDDEIYLLKALKPAFVEHGETYYSIGEAALAEITIAKYVHQLIRKLRLYKEGEIHFHGSFSICKENRKVISKRLMHRKPVGGSYTIKEFDLPELSKLLSADLKVPELIQLAINSFELAYDTSETKVKFVLLMIALESIYNRSSQEPIKHIIARHLALTLCTSREDFNYLFKKVKKLYDTRCDIVHGNNDKRKLIKIQETIYKDFVELETLTRKVIMKLLFWYDFESGEPTKEALFEYLNRKGFAG